jgi:hypothetical protein
VSSSDEAILEDLTQAWILIDRASSFDRARACAEQIVPPYARASILLTLARYAYRLDESGHVPLPDDAPQPPPRARLLDGFDMVPMPRVRLD